MILSMWNRAHVYVALCNTSFAGYVVFYPQGDHYHLENLAVLPNRAGKGIGKRLQAFIMARLKVDRSCFPSRLRKSNIDGLRPRNLRACRSPLPNCLRSGYLRYRVIGIEPALLGLQTDNHWTVCPARFRHKVLGDLKCVLTR